MSSPDRRRRCILASSLPALVMLAAGCASSPPRRWHRLPLDVPDAPVPVPPAQANSQAWEVSARIALPAYLDREELLIDAGQGQVLALPNDRWAEPLADAVQRLLLHDLTLLRAPGTVWLAPAPANAGAALRLRVAVMALQAEPAQARLRLQARWTFQGPGAAPNQRQVTLESPLADASPAALVRAHRLALWQLAQRIVADGN